MLSPLRMSNAVNGGELRSPIKEVEDIGSLELLSWNKLKKLLVLRAEEVIDPGLINFRRCKENTNKI